MGDEGRFYRALQLAGNFERLKIKFNIIHPNSYKYYLEVDNSAQKGAVLFIFEGKASKEEEAREQLKQRYLSCTKHRSEYLRGGLFKPYSVIRLFFYSFNKHALIEFTPQGGRNAVKFSDLNELSVILRNL